LELAFDLGVPASMSLTAAILAITDRDLTERLVAYRAAHTAAVLADPSNAEPLP
jgi:phosphoribosylcarboxyaminoimidazole (NCAIR) mutase